MSSLRTQDSRATELVRGCVRVSVVDRTNGIDRVFRKAHDQQADHRVPEADNGPGQRHHETQEDKQVEAANSPPGDSVTAMRAVRPTKLTMSNPVKRDTARGHIAGLVDRKETCQRPETFF